MVRKKVKSSTKALSDLRCHGAKWLRNFSLRGPSIIGNRSFVLHLGISGNFVVLSLVKEPDVAYEIVRDIDLFRNYALDFSAAGSPAFHRNTEQDIHLSSTCTQLLDHSTGSPRL